MHSQIGITVVGQIAPTARVAQPQGAQGTCKGFSRALTWGGWLPENVSVVLHMLGPKDRSGVAHGVVSSAQLLLGSIPCRCARRWLLL